MLGFGPRNSNEQELIPFPPSPAIPEQSPRGHDDDEEVEAEGDIVVEVEDLGEEDEEIGPPSLRFLLDQTLRVTKSTSSNNTMPTESAALSYDLNRALFVGPENLEKLEDRIRHTYHPPLTTKIALLVRVDLTQLLSKLIVYGVFPSFTMDTHRKLVSYE